MALERHTSILTPYEAVRYSSARRDYPAAEMCNVIPQIEQEVIHKCLSDDLWDFLLLHLREIPETAAAWDSGQTYSSGDVVVVDGCLYESTANSNTTNPLAQGSAWTPWARFDNEAATVLWNDYLRRLLAQKCLLATITPATLQAGSGGLITSNRDLQGWNTADKVQMSDFKKSVLDDVERVTSNMLEFLSDNANEYPTAVYPCDGGQDCNSQAKRNRRRWAFAQ